MVSGESTFITQAVAESDNGNLALAPDTPGQVIALELGEKQYRLNDGAFLALDGTAFYTMERQSIGKALFGGQGGFFVMTTQGQGTLLANAFGSIKKIELQNLVRSMYKVSIFKALQAHLTSISKKVHNNKKTRTETQASCWISLSWFFNREVDS